LGQSGTRGSGNEKFDHGDGALSQHSLGRAMAERIKSEGKTLNELVAKKAKALFGPQANFNSLSEVQKIRYMQVSLNPQASLTHK
jgi:hypothetical protein